MYVQHQRPNLPLSPPAPRVQQSTLNPRELKTSQRHLKTTYPMLGFSGDEISVPSTQTIQPSCSFVCLQCNYEWFQMLPPGRPQKAAERCVSLIL